MFSIFNTIFKYKEKESPDKLGLFPDEKTARNALAQYLPTLKRWRA